MRTARYGASTMIRVYRDAESCTMEKDGSFVDAPAFDFDELFTSSDPQGYAEQNFAAGEKAQQPEGPLLAPLGSQEIWAAGVTYFQSRTARMEESENSGGDRFYDLVYEAERPELFFKATAARARGHLAPVGIRSDSTWDVPEPELTLALNSNGRVFGYTIGNDMSSRSIEGENPLYLPQAKVYRASCALGPCLVVGADAIDSSSKIEITIERAEQEVFAGEIDVAQIKRGFEELSGFLFQDNEFPVGALLMTGTGVVPDSDFTLASGDVIRISIDGIGTLENPVA